ncbi:hypothetical protein Ancab_010402 [Ancistrocladus abbreviatus]
MAAVVKNKQGIFRDYMKTCPKESDMVVRDDMQGISLKVEEGSNAILLQNLYLSCDPYLRNRMAKIDHPSDSSYRSFTPGSSLFKIQHAHDIPLSYDTGILGMHGLTAYVGLHEVGNPKKEEKVFISSAFGAVGQLVGQFG